MARTAAIAKNTSAKTHYNVYGVDPATGKRVRSFYLDPTPEEIKEYAARQEEIRSQWSALEEYRRFAGPKTKYCDERSYAFDYINFSFTAVATRA